MVGRVVVVLVRAVVVEVAGRVVVPAVDVRAAGRVAVEGARVTDDRFSAVEEAAATLDRRSTVLVLGRVDGRVLAVPASDMRLAVPAMPRFSSPELATERAFSSAELLTEARDRWEAVVEVLSGRRVELVVEVVEGRVGGRFRVPPLVEVRAVVVLVVLEMELGRFVAVVPDTGRLVAVVDLAGDALTFSLSLAASGLVTGSSLPDRTVESTGVAGGAVSESTSAGASVGAGVSAGGASAAGTSAGAAVGTGSSVEAMFVSVERRWGGRERKKEKRGRV